MTMQYGPSARRTLGVRELRHSTTGMANDNVLPVKKTQFCSYLYRITIQKY